MRCRSLAAALTPSLAVKTYFASAALLVLLTVATSAGADSLQLALTLRSPTPQPNADFGQAVAFRGDEIFISQQDIFGVVPSVEYRPGAIYVFDADTGAHLRTLADPVPAPAGCCLKHDFGETMVVTDTHVFVSSDNEVHQLDADTGALVRSYTEQGNCCLGGVLGVSGDRLLVGEPRLITTINDLRGAGHVFDHTTGGLLLSAPLPPYLPGDLGATGAWIGPDLLLGAELEPQFNFLVNTCESRLFDGTTGAELVSFPGNRVAAFSGDVLAGCRDAGLGLADGLGLYDGTTGVLLTSFDPLPNETSDGFPYALGEFDGHVVATAPQANADLDPDLPGGRFGKVFLLSPTTGEVVQTLNHLEPGRRFGQAIAQRDDADLLVGSPGTKGTFITPGAAFLYRNGPDPLPCLASERPEKVRLKHTQDLPDASLSLRLPRGQAATSADFGDPTTVDDYEVSVLLDYVSPLYTGTVPAGATCGGKPCWRSSGSGSLRYKDRDGLADAITKIVLKPGTAGRSKLVVKAEGSPIGLVSPLYLPIKVRVKPTTGRCWEVCFSASGVVENALGGFKGKGEPCPQE